MILKKKVKPKWGCKICGKNTGLPGRICVECKTDHTAIRGNVAKKTASSRKSSASKGQKKPSGKAPTEEIKDSTMCGALGRALDLETEGRQFYLRCAQSTTSPEGKNMFTFLANEEKLHYERIAELYEREEYKAYCDYVEAKGLTTGVFEKRVKGGNLDEKSDALSALNVGIKAEENSIELYSTLANGASSEQMRMFFERLVSEERNHRNILGNEIEFVTGTGDFRDFTAVTM
ncbi:MAG: ferritin family protein [Candidatus Altiarchaeota archaeon]